MRVTFAAILFANFLHNEEYKFCQVLPGRISQFKHPDGSRNGFFDKMAAAILLKWMKISPLIR